MSERSNVILTFYSNLGKIVRLNIPRADLTLTAPRAGATMEGMIDGDIIVNSAGSPTAIHGAKLLTTTRTPLVSL